MTDEFGRQGAQEPSDNQGEFNALSFVATQLISRLNIATLVRVVAVDDAGGLSIAGTVDVQPLVNQLDGALNAVPHGVLYSLPYMRIQGGTNAFVVVPKVDDIGIALFADRDISSVVAAKDQANPGSLRRFDMADGMYIGGMLNAVPTRFIRIDDLGITIDGHDKVTINGTTSVTVNSGDIELKGNTKVTGLFHATGAVTLDTTLHVGGVVTTDSEIDAAGDVKAAGLSAYTHRHGGVQTGGGFSGAPVN